MKWTTPIWVTVASLSHCRPAIAAETQSVEVDLIFPRDGGRYSPPDGGLPFTIALQNSPAAFEYGYNVWIDLYRNPRNDRRLGDESVYFDNQRGSPPANATDPYFLTQTTGLLRPGEYTVEWSLGVRDYCEFINTTRQNESIYYGNREISSGTINITVLDETNSTLADSPPDLLAANPDRQCAKNLGVIGYASTTQYFHAAHTLGAFDSSSGAYVYPASVEPCIVTQSPTQSPNPCALTVDRAVQTTIYSLMSWSMPPSSSAASSAPGPSATGLTTTGDASPLKGRTGVLPYVFLEALCLVALLML